MQPQVHEVRKNQPTPGDVHVNRPLTNISVAFVQSQDAFIADKAAHVIPVDRQTDLYYKIPKGAFFRDEAQKRAPGAESAGSGFTVETDSYRCDVFAFHHDIPDQRRANEDSPLSSDRAATVLCTQKGLLRREVSFADTFLKSGVWTTNLQGVASSESLGTSFRQWSDYANSDPIGDMAWAQTKVHETTGFRPKHAIFTRPVWDALKNHPDIVARVNAGQTPGGPAMVTRAVVAALMELEEILVMDAVRDSAKEGAAASMGFLGGKQVLLYYKPPVPDIMVPAAFYGFAWRTYSGMNNMGIAIRKFRMEHLRSDRVEMEMAFGWELVAADLAVRLYDVVA